MLLSDKSITSIDGLIENMNKDNLQSSSYDLTLDEMVSINTGDKVICIKFGEPVIAKAKEKVNLPPDIAATVILKSSYIRQGLSVEPGHYDAGFSGYPNVQISTKTNRTLFLHSGKPFAQIVFYRVDKSANKPYNGHYQNQNGVHLCELSDSTPGKAYGMVTD